jgi:hypothetical protein
MRRAATACLPSPLIRKAVLIDGFELVASRPVAYGMGIGTKPASHHVWMINNVIQGYGQGGIGTNEADWLFVLHNTVYDNTRVTCDAQGSGIGLVVAKTAPGRPRPPPIRRGHRFIKSGGRTSSTTTY